jgi:cation diffusion facilitator CzcD-associated flavoprotein CzcO
VDHGCDLTGQRVAVIGTGASAAQFVPQISRTAARVVVFQRTAPWVVPRSDRRISRIEHAAHRVVPPLQRLRRAVIYWLHEVRVLGMVFNPKLMKVAEKVALAHLRRSISDPIALRCSPRPMTPTGCTPGRGRAAVRSRRGRVAGDSTQSG